MSELTPADLELLAAARTATLATVAPDGQPRLVPVCFVVDVSAGSSRLWIALDEKPKQQSSDPRDLARVRDILARPHVVLLAERWSEDWSRLAWLRLYGEALLREPASVPAGVIEALRAKYPQYGRHALERRPMLDIVIQRVTRWVAGS